MKRFSLVAVSLIVLSAISAMAAPNPNTAKVPPFTGTLVNAHYVYVASYDGDQFNPNLLPRRPGRDRRRPGCHSEVGQTDDRLPARRGRHRHPRVQQSFRRSDGRVRCAPGVEWQFSLARHGSDGLQSGETPLVTQFEKGFEGVQKRK
jgi:hypothetical protein